MTGPKPSCGRRRAVAVFAVLLAGCASPDANDAGETAGESLAAMRFLTLDSGEPLALRFSSYHPDASNCTMSFFASAKDLVEGPFQLAAIYTIDEQLEFAHVKSVSEAVRFHAGGLDVGPANVTPGGTHSGYLEVSNSSVVVQGNLTLWLFSAGPGRLDDAPVRDASMMYDLACDKPFALQQTVGGRLEFWMPPNSEEGVGIGVIPNGNVAFGSGRTLQADVPTTLALLVLPGGQGTVTANGPGVGFQRDLADGIFFGRAEGPPGEYAVRADRVDPEGEGRLLVVFALLDRPLDVQALGSPIVAP